MSRPLDRRPVPSQGRLPSFALRITMKTSSQSWVELVRIQAPNIRDTTLCTRTVEALRTFNEQYLRIARHLATRGNNSGLTVAYRLLRFLYVHKWAVPVNIEALAWEADLPATILEPLRDRCPDRTVHHQLEVLGSAIIRSSIGDESKAPPIGKVEVTV